MKTALLCISDPYMQRGMVLADFYRSRGDEVLILTPDFSHRQKRVLKPQEMPDGVELIHHMPFKRNLSAQRLYGHRQFAIGCAKKLEEWKPDRIHCLVPCNTLTKEMAEYKKKHPRVQLIFDLNDLWPESLLGGRKDWIWPMKKWRQLRDDNLQAADLRLVECDLFLQYFSKLHPDLSFYPLYWARREKVPQLHPKRKAEQLDLVFLGSINNITDLDLLSAFLSLLNSRKKVIFHLIASGEQKEKLISDLESLAIEVVDHGTIFDTDAKQTIFDRCHFGLNPMKSTVLAGLSMKSLDYLAAGLPIINSARGDLKTLCLQEKAGFQLSFENMSELADVIASLKPSQIEEMALKAREIYETKYDLSIFNRNLETWLSKIEEKQPA